MSVISKAPDSVGIAIDPHKASWTAGRSTPRRNPWPPFGSRSAVTATGAAPLRAGGPTRHGQSKAQRAWARR